MASKSWNIKLWLKAFAPAVIWAAIIFLFSSQPTLPGFDSGFLDFVLKKSAHMFVYGVLFWLVSRGVDMVVGVKTNIRVRLLVPLVIVLFYAISDELHQSLVPGRYPTLRDIGYDLLGALVVLLRKHKYI